MRKVQRFSVTTHTALQACEAACNMNGPTDSCGTTYQDWEQAQEVAGLRRAPPAQPSKVSGRECMRPCKQRHSCSAVCTHRCMLGHNGYVDKAFEKRELSGAAWFVLRAGGREAPGHGGQAASGARPVGRTADSQATVGHMQ